MGAMSDRSTGLKRSSDSDRLRDFCTGCSRLPPCRIRERDLDFGRLASLGKLIGPPWTQDQKYAAAAAFQALNAGH